MSKVIKVGSDTTKVVVNSKNIEIKTSQDTVIKMSEGVTGYYDNIMFDTYDDDPNYTTKGTILSNHANGPPKDDGQQYWLIITRFYESLTDWQKGAHQIAHPWGYYSTNKVYQRHRAEGEWFDWVLLGGHSDLFDDSGPYADGDSVLFTFRDQFTGLAYYDKLHIQGTISISDTEIAAISKKIGITEALAQGCALIANSFDDTLSKTARVYLYDITTTGCKIGIKTTGENWTASLDKIYGIR